jgi:hypothetical protein
MAFSVLTLLAVCFRQFAELNRINDRLNEARAENLRLRRRVILTEAIIERTLEDPGAKGEVWDAMFWDWRRYQDITKNIEDYTKDKANKK